jgi:hypothetical protein
VETLLAFALGGVPLAATVTGATRLGYRGFTLGTGAGAGAVAVAVPRQFRHIKCVLFFPTMHLPRIDVQGAKACETGPPASRDVPAVWSIQGDHVAPP